MAERLYRSRDERIIGGVAGGIAENLDLDPAIVRIGWVLLALVAPITPLVYFVLMFVIPEEPDVTTTESSSVPASVSTATTTATPNMLAAPDGQREARREERREARRAARATRGGGDRSATMIFGVLLVLVGGWFLVRPYLPRLDVGAYWPYLVVGLGVVLIGAALARGRATR